VEGGGETAGYGLLTDLRTCWCVSGRRVSHFIFRVADSLFAWPLLFCGALSLMKNTQVEGAQPKRMELDFSAMDAQAKDTVRPNFYKSSL
jgi:hypothetical protein